jgi:3-hydroxymyristoyl/3-hydroxydecanoyl-(acyl carrier protein) dehydratase
LQIDIELIKAGTKIGKAKAVCAVGGGIVSEAEITFALVDEK